MPSDTQAYLFRVAPNHINKIDDALRRDRVYIGWRVPSLLDPDLTKREFKAEIRDAYPDYNPKQLGKATAHMWRFIREMRTGTVLVVAPMDTARRLFYLARVTGPPRLYEGPDPDIAFERRVE